MIPQQQIEHIKERANDDIVSIIEKYMKLKGSRGSYKGLCPFHDENTPSFSVSESKGIYKCFGCGEGGDAVKFIMQQEGLDFIETIRWLAKDLNIIIQEEKPDQPKKDYVPPAELIPGIKEAKKHIRKEGSAVLCFTEKMRNRLYSKSLRSVLYCPRYRPGQVELIAKYTDKVIIIPRGLNQRKFFKALEITCAAGLNIELAKDVKETPMHWSEFIITHFERSEELRKQCIKVLAAIYEPVKREIESAYFFELWDKSEPEV